VELWVEMDGCVRGELDERTDLVAYRSIMATTKTTKGKAAAKGAFVVLFWELMLMKV